MYVSDQICQMWECKNGELNKQLINNIPLLAYISVKHMVYSHVL